MSDPTDTRPADPRELPGSYERKGAKITRVDDAFEPADVAEGRGVVLDEKVAKATNNALEAAGFPPAPTIEVAPQTAPKPAPQPAPPAPGRGDPSKD